MLKKTMLTVLAAFFAAALHAAPVMAAADHSGFGPDLFTGQTPDGMKDPVDADAAAVAAAAMEPAAGGDTPFTATQGAEGKTGPQPESPAAKSAAGDRQNEDNTSAEH